LSNRTIPLNARPREPRRGKPEIPVKSIGGRVKPNRNRDGPVIRTTRIRSSDEMGNRSSRTISAGTARKRRRRRHGNADGRKQSIRSATGARAWPANRRAGPLSERRPGPEPPPFFSPPRRFLRALRIYLYSEWYRFLRRLHTGSSFVRFSFVSPFYFFYLRR